VNGRKVEPSLNEPTEEAGCAVNDGDLVTVGGTTLRVDVMACPEVRDKREDESGWEAGELASRDCSLPC
jgi:hypothetical protein